MKNYFIIIPFFLIFACGKKQPTLTPVDAENLTVIQKDSILETFDFNFSQAIHQDSSEYLFIPLTSPLLSNSYNRKGFSSYSSKGGSVYWNILFYNYLTNESKLLTTKKLRIEDYDYDLNSGDSILSESLLYRIIEEDTDGNDNLDYEDELGLYISTTSGKNLRRISPKGEGFTNYTIIPNTDKLIIRTAKIISEPDDTKTKVDRYLYLLDLANEFKLIKLIDSTSRQKIEEIYFDNWLKK